MLQIFNNILNKLFWLKVLEHKDLIKINHQASKPFENELPAFDYDDINKSFDADNKKWFHNEFVYVLENGTLIEPSNKICIKGFRTLVTESFSSGNDRPSLKKYLLFRLFFKRTIKIEQAILFDGTTGSNYFHFFSEVINKIWLTEPSNLNKSVPFIISENTFKTTYFQYFYQHTNLKEYKWIVQRENDWIKADKLWLLKPFPYKKVYWQKTIELLKITYSEKSKKRVFLNRSEESGRFISNFSAVEVILKKFDFEIVDTATWNFNFEFNYFSEISLLIGIHGAGNTNVIFANTKIINFIEIFPANNISCQFYWLCKMLDIPYNVIKGENLDSRRGFYLNPEHLEKVILKMISN